MKKTIVTCDCCDAEMVQTGDIAQYQLKLSSNMFSNPRPENGLMYSPPLLDTDKYFCGFECLSKWMDARKQPNEKS
jgi:hypothetical protein